MTTVQEILNENPDRLASRKNVYALINKAVKFVGRRLVSLQSNIISADYSLTYAASEPFKEMPSDCWGLRTFPFIPSTKTMLIPIPDFKYEVLSYGLTGIPEYFKLMGNNLYLYNIPGSETTIKGLYYKAPIKLTKPNDVIPWSGLFDDVVTELFYYFVDPSKGDISILSQVDIIALCHGMQNQGQISM